MELVRYEDVSKEMYEEYIGEWEATGELIVPSVTNRENRTFEEVYQRWEFEETDAVYEKGLVKATIFFLVDDERILGAIHLRHELNDFLLNTGGHIGYGVRKSERHKGYGHKMLSLLLTKLKALDYTKVLLTCDDDNLSSSKTIEKNGGILENKIMYEGKLNRRYWIKL